MTALGRSRIRPSPVAVKCREADRSTLFPLDVFYNRAGLPLPIAHRVDPRAIPDPYRQLLDHALYMTTTLESYFDAVMTVWPLAIYIERSRYWRRVLLVQQGGGPPVEMGAICVQLEGFDEQTRVRILEARIPLGRILDDGSVKVNSKPVSFFSVIPNAEMMAVFWMSEQAPLYGRRAQLVVGKRKIGDIVEILSPIRNNRGSYQRVARRHLCETPDMAIASADPTRRRR